MKMYSDSLKKYFNQDDHHGQLEGNDVIHLHEENEKLQYDIDLYVQANATHICAARFKAFGDPNMIAALAWFCEQLDNQSINELTPLNAIQTGEALQLHITKMYAATVIQSLMRQLQERFNER